MKVRNISGEPRFVPELNRVIDTDEIVEVPDERHEGYICQPLVWGDERGGKRK